MRKLTLIFLCFLFSFTSGWSARLFDGVDDKIAPSSAFDLDDFTLEFWAKTTTSGQKAFIGVVETGTAGLLQILTNLDKDDLAAANKTKFNVRVNGSEHDTAEFLNAAVYDGSSHHHALVRSGDTTTYYVDGSSQTLTYLVNSLSTSTVTITRTIRIGARNLRGTDDLFLDTTIANFRIWKRALSAAEVGALASCGHVALTARHIDYPLWGTASPEADLSGNANNGTVSGAVAADHICGPYR